MCGIIGIVTNDKPKQKKIKRNIYNIYFNQNKRGREGAGYAHFKDGKIITSRYKKPEDMLKSFFQDNIVEANNCYLFHHRIPTCTPNSPEFNHPLTSKDGLITVIHNGIINNSDSHYEKYVEELQTYYEDKKGVTFTDSELITLILAEELKDKKEPYNHNAVKKAIGVLSSKLRGSFAIAFLIKGDNKIWLLKNGNPLVVYRDIKNNWYFSSEEPKSHGAFKDFVEMKDGEVATLSNKGFKLMFTLTEEQISNMNNLKYWNKTRTYTSTRNDDHTIWSNGFQEFDNCEVITYKKDSSQTKLTANNRSVNRKFSGKLPIQVEDYYSESDLNEYYGKLRRRNKARFSFIFSNIYQEATKDDWEPLFEEIVKGRHPIKSRTTLEIIDLLRGFKEMNKIEDVKFFNLASKIKDIVENNFLKLTTENFVLLRLSNYYKLHRDSLLRSAEWLLENESGGKEMLDTFLGEANDLAASDWRTLISQLKLLEEDYFEDRLRKNTGRNRGMLTENERNAINSLFMPTKHNNVDDVLDKVEKESLKAKEWDYIQDRIENIAESEVERLINDNEIDMQTIDLEDYSDNRGKIEMEQLREAIDAERDSHQDYYYHQQLGKYFNNNGGM